MKIVIDIDDEDYKRIQDVPDVFNSLTSRTYSAIKNGTLLPRCNQCRYYEGVHNVQGHAPCKFHGSGGVLWYWYCSQFKLEETNDGTCD